MYSKGASGGHATQPDHQALRTFSASSLGMPYPSLLESPGEDCAVCPDLKFPHHCSTQPRLPSEPGQSSGGSRARPAGWHRPIQSFGALSWMCHVLGFDEGVEFFGADESQFDGGFAEADAGVMGGFGDLGSGVVADFGSEGSDQHQGIVDVVFDLCAVDFDALDAMPHEAVHGAGEELDGVEIVEDDDGLENVELEIALRAGKTDGGVVAHHLYGDHGECFGLRGIHLAGHDAGAGLVFRKNKFAEAAARAGSEPTNVVGDFHERGGERFQRAAREDEFVMRAERG